MIRAADSSVGMMMMDHTIICLRNGELLMSSSMVCLRNCRNGTQSQNLKPLLPFWQQQRNLHHFSSPVQNPLKSNPVSLLHIRGFNSRADHAKLGLPQNASKAEVKSAYFSLAKKLHPDNGGNAKEFNEITEAYKRLTSDSGYPPGYGTGSQSQYDRSQYSGSNQDPSWMDEMERRRVARQWMEQRMMEEEWARRRDQQKDWQNYQNYGRGDPDRQKIVMMSFGLLMMGTLVFLQAVFYSITPSGCSQYEQDCTCTRCIEHERWDYDK